jgi:hypothetical protein
VICSPTRAKIAKCLKETLFLCKTDFIFVISVSKFARRCGRFLFMHSEIRQQLETYTESFQILSYNRYGRYRQTLADRKINKLGEIPGGGFFG